MNYRSYWYLDDVSVTNGSNQLLLNGGFESGSFMPGWDIKSDFYFYGWSPNSQVEGSFLSFSPKEGSFQLIGYYRWDGFFDTITQSFPVIVNSTYTVRFWLLDLGGSSDKYVKVTLS
ncbi:unnamed protein product [Adineta steineri]|uniref:Uncharacterized protein n=1 Tax=Adineta steineri TaxID=433720 RepID=A0A819LJB7_9BILA|nr:unnamed protein product [Adineta steineri]